MGVGRGGVGVARKGRRGIGVSVVSVGARVGNGSAAGRSTVRVKSVVWDVGETASGRGSGASETLAARARQFALNRRTFGG